MLRYTEMNKFSTNVLFNRQGGADWRLGVY